MRKLKKKLHSFLAYLLVTVTVLSYIPVCPQVKAAGGSASSFSGKKQVVVSLGDSYSSGEGLKTYIDQDTSWVDSQNWCAHRAENSWPSQLEFSNIGPLTLNDNWYFVATSGATTAHLGIEIYDIDPGYTSKQHAEYHDVNSNPYIWDYQFRKDYQKQKGLRVISGTTWIESQLAVFDRVRRDGKEVAYVTMTMGGNDAQFSDVIMTAANGKFNKNAVPDFINHIWKRFYAEGGIKDDLYAAYHKVAEAAGPQATIIVAGYPQLFSGSFATITSQDIRAINEAVSQFNKEIEEIVKTCQNEGMRIQFVSVEQAFEGRGAYSKDTEFINQIGLLHSQDLDDFAFPPVTAGSMHPNKHGAAAYKNCVNLKIKELEAQQEQEDEDSEQPVQTRSNELEVVLVLDTSGSMSGQPMSETIKASTRFVDTVLSTDAAVGIVTYDYGATKLSDFSRSSYQLNQLLTNVYAGGSTNTEGGLSLAREMLKNSDAKKKIIVLMSDGLPNIGREGDALIEYADSIKKDGISIFTLGFFSDLGSSEKASAQYLMDGIASEGKHYEVSRAEDLVLFFGDIADQISDTRYIYIKIACPVDVTVTYNGETLTSVDNLTGQRTNFGTLTFEENPDGDNDETTDDRIKILRLKEGADYDIRIEGNGRGKMTYTIGFANEDGEYSDMRKFSNIKVTKRTEIQTTAAYTSATYLKVDRDGDGVYEDVYKAEEDSRGEAMDLSYVNDIALIIVGVIVLLLLSAHLIRRARKKQAPPIQSISPSTDESAAAKTSDTQDEDNTDTAPKTETASTPDDKPTPPAEPTVKLTAFCHNCGKKRRPESQFCPYCGKKFNQ